MKKVSFPRTPNLQKLSNRGIIFVLHCALKRIKLNVILFSGGETPPLRLKRIYCRGRRPRRPNCIVCRKTIFERTMYAKAFPSGKFFVVTMSNIYAIGCRTSKFNIAISEFGSRHCRPFFKKVAKKPNTRLKYRLYTYLFTDFY